MDVHLYWDAGQLHSMKVSLERSTAELPPTMAGPGPHREQYGAS